SSSSSILPAWGKVTSAIMLALWFACGSQADPAIAHSEDQQSRPTGRNASSSVAPPISSSVQELPSQWAAATSVPEPLLVRSRARQELAAVQSTAAGSWNGASVSESIKLAVQPLVALP